MATELSLNDTTMPFLPVNLSDVTSPTPLNSSRERGWTERCADHVGSGSMNCNVALRDVSLCSRLAPPPVPPWLRHRPSRLQQLTSRCPSWTVYQERCNSWSGNATWDYPNDEEERAEQSSQGTRWVIPVLTVLVVMLLLLLALVLYKYYSRAHERNKFRLSGAGYRFKPSQSGGSWTGGPLTGSDTSESYLSQSASSTAPGFRYARSPVCRLLDQTQYVATPTEEEHRPRPPEPPAFTSPAYFLPSLSWLRFPALRQAWPGEGSDPQGGSAMYTAPRLMQCDCEQTVHRWLGNEDRVAESGTASDPEYSEIWEGPPQYSSLPQTPCMPSHGIGPYEYEMQEAGNRHTMCECEPSVNPPHRPGRWIGHGHGYDKLWQCGEGKDRLYSPKETCSPNLGHGENGWLSRYRLPNPCSPMIDQVPDRGVGHVHRPHRAHLPSSWGEPGTGQALGRDRQTRVGGLMPDNEFLPCHRPTFRDCSLVPSSVWETDQDRTDGRSQVKYVNPVYEGQGPEAACVSGSSPLLTRLWGYIGLNNKS